MPRFTVCVDPERLISEVRERPILYNTSLPDNCNKRYKANAWMEITEVIMYGAWNELSNKDRLLKCREIQLKWKYLRDNFRRELILRKSDQGASVKKKKYRYYSQLLFLVPFIKIGNAPIEPEAVKDEPSETSHSEASENAQDANDNENNDGGDQSFEYFVNVDDYNVMNNQDTLNVEMQKIKGLTDVDEDSLFCISLIESLKRMSLANKLSAKIEILNAIRRFSYPNGDAEGNQ